MWQLIVPAVAQILDKLIPDPQAKAQAQLELMRLTQNGELAQLEAVKAVALAQSATNTVEASQGTFRGGWRPFIGWTCGAALCYQYLMRPLLPWTLASFGVPSSPMPSLDVDQIMALVFGMLGLGTLRTYEKVKATA